MDDHAHQIAAAKLRQYEQLKVRQYDLYATIAAIADPEPSGPHGQNAFTSNWRESRVVVNLTIEFSPTRGGAHAVNKHLEKLNVSAPRLGAFLLAELRDELKTVEKTMAEL